MKMQKSNKSNNDIAKVAYELYEKRGKTHGYNFNDWIEAEKIVMERHVKEIENKAEKISTAKGKKTTSKTKSKALKSSIKSSGKITKKTPKKITKKATKKTTKKAVKKATKKITKKKKSD